VSEPIVMENEGAERIEYGIKWDFPNGSVSYAGPFAKDNIGWLIGRRAPLGMTGQAQTRTVTTTRWEPAEPVLAAVHAGFAIGIGEQIHAVNPKRHDGREGHAECDQPVDIAQTWGRFHRINEHLVTRTDLCGYCCWAVAISEGTTELELARYVPSSGEADALRRFLPDPLMFVRLCEAILTAAREERGQDSDHPVWLQRLGHATAHRPLVLLSEECRENDCDHVDTQECFAQSDCVACETCSTQAGSWAGEWEGQYDLVVRPPCSALGRMFEHYSITAVPS